jgi:2-polyprenyl-6-methoxyphenol hydroxylase-like FAD-dependent oxidoreductase
MIWFTDPQWAAAFPTDSNLTFYAAMPTMDRLPEFKEDAERALISFLANLPDPPPIHEQRRVDDVIGKIDMTNRVREQTAPGLALVGDAALATDPLFGVGCGWAFQSGEWLADSVAPALRGSEPLENGLRRYRRAHDRHLRGHAFLIHDYATGRRVNPGERMLFKAATRDPRVAIAFEQLATRQVGPARTLAKAIPASILVNARHALSGRGGAASSGSPRPASG